jgi:RNA polymerase sigma-70 factor (sigma-E family)
MRTEAQQEYVDYVTANLVALRHLAYLLCGDEHLANDIVQQTITKLFVRWRRLQHIEHLDRYVRTMLVNTFLDERRRPWSRVVRLVDRPVEPPPAPDQPVEETIVVRAALAKMPRKQQVVLVLRFLCDLSIEEVAEIMGCSPGTVKSQSSRGLTKLRELLEGDRMPLRNGV